MGHVQGDGNMMVFSNAKLIHEPHMFEISSAFLQGKKLRNVELHIVVESLLLQEAQLHGEIDLAKHVDSLVAHERHRPQNATAVVKRRYGTAAR